MSTKIYFKGTADEAKELVHNLGAILSGKMADDKGIGKAFASVIGWGVLSSVKDAFVVKSRGGTDELGISWPKLTKAYVAYQRRFGPGEKAKLKKGHGLGRGHHHGGGTDKGLLSASQQTKWKMLFARYFNKLSLTMPLAEAKKRAAQIAWAIIKREGGKTMLEVFGNREVDILRDTGILLGSLSPGEITEEGDYTQPTDDGGNEQVFILKPGSVIVGSKVVYANAHDKGIPGKLPRRQFIPDDGQIPDSWWNMWLDKAAKTLERVIPRLFQP